MKVLIINGPNLNLLGRREPGVYGSASMQECLERLYSAYPGVEIEYFQSNHEGALIDRLHEDLTATIKGSSSMPVLIPTRRSPLPTRLPL